jgi:hypothetical protein
MRLVHLVLAATLLAGSSASFAASGAKYYVVLSDVLGASASNFAGPYASKAACQSDAKAFEAQKKSPVEAYICVHLKKAEIDAMTDKDRQALEQNMLNTK